MTCTHITHTVFDTLAMGALFVIGNEGQGGQCAIGNEGP